MRNGLWVVSAGAVLLGATLVVVSRLTPPATADTFVPFEEWLDFRDRLATADTAIFLLSGTSGHPHDLAFQRWLLADRATGRVEFFPAGLGRGGNEAYILDGQSVWITTVHPTGGLRAEGYGPMARQLADEVMSGFEHCTLEREYGAVIPHLPFPWAQGIEIFIDFARPELDKSVHEPGAVWARGWGPGPALQIQDVRWNVPLPPSFYENTPTAVHLTFRALDEYIANTG